MIGLMAESCNNSFEQMKTDMSRRKYFTPEAAVEYGIIDHVVTDGWGDRLEKMRSMEKNLSDAQTDIFSDDFAIAEPARRMIVVDVQPSAPALVAAWAIGIAAASLVSLLFGSACCKV